MTNNKLAQVFHFDLYGKRDDKYDFLNENNLASIDWNELQPNEPNYFMVNKDFDAQNDYELGFKVNELFPVNNVGIVTSRDSFVIDENKLTLENRIKDFFTLTKDELQKKYALKENASWKIEEVQQKAKEYNNSDIYPISYRPFDKRFLYYNNLFIERSRTEVMQHFLRGENVGLVIARQCASDWRYVFISNLIGEFNLTGTAGRFGSGNIFPLYLYPETSTQQGFDQTTERQPNLNVEIVNQIAEKLNLKFVAEKFSSNGGVSAGRGGKENGRNTKNYMALPYNPKLKQRARELRQAGYLSEVLFWNQVKNKQFRGFDFDRQKIIGNYIVDFYCSNCNVVIEIDGSSHDDKVEYDAQRDAFLQNLELTVIHIPVADVMNNMNGVMEMLFDHPALKDALPAEGNEPFQLSSPEGYFAPIDILDYIYAVLHSPSYREKYKEFLKIDFPRVPYPKNADTFWQLVKLGSQIRQIHLLESPISEKYITQYPMDGDNVVGKTKYQDGNVYINDMQYFANVPQVAWEFYIGGYQPAQKWLKDRKDRTLDFEDILHYQKIIVALSETDRLMKEVDKIEIE